MITQEYLDSLDKRTNEYKKAKKEFDAQGKKMSDKHRTTQYYTQEELNEKYEANKGKGLGDVVESITKATGIDKLVKFVAGEDCGCDERKKKLNNLRFRKQPLCLNEEEYNFLHKLYNKGSKTIGHTEKETLVKIEERIFQKKYVESLNCAPCIIQVYKDLKEIYDVYN